MILGIVRGEVERGIDTDQEVEIGNLQFNCINW